MGFWKYESRNSTVSVVFTRNKYRLMYSLISSGARAYITIISENSVLDEVLNRYTGPIVFNDDESGNNSGANGDSGNSGSSGTTGLIGDDDEGESGGGDDESGNSRIRLK